MDTDKKKEFEKRISSVNTKWNKVHKVTGGRDRIRLGSDVPEATLISTGNPALDWGLGGGIPEGTIFEIFGSAGVGKTVAMSYIMAEVQKLDKYVIYYHTEESRKPKKAWELAGVDENRVIYIDARNSGEDGINAIKDILINEFGDPSDLVGMIAVDSISALAPNAEMNSVEGNGVEGVTVARQAALTSKLFRVICGSGWLQEGCIIGLVNQERSQIGTTPMPNVSSGGKAMQYYPKIKVQLKAPKDGYLLDDQKQIIGHTVHYFVTKNNAGIAPPYKRGSWKVIYNKGIDYLGPVIDEALSYGIIKEPAKARFVARWISDGKIQESDKIHGRVALYSYVENSKEVQDGLQESVSRVRQYSLSNKVEIMDGLVLVNGKETDILEEVVAQTTEDTTQVVLENTIEDTLEG